MMSSRSPAGRHLWLGACLLVLFTVLDSSSRAADPEPRAADLVTDGQLIDTTSSRYKSLFAELTTRYNFSQEELARLFNGVSIRKKVLELMDTQWEAKPYYLYFPAFIDEKTIQTGREKLIAHHDLLDRIEQEIGVEREIVVAIWGIESRYGRNKGSYEVFQTLNTMFDAYPRRRAFYRDELINFLLLCRENQMDPLSIMGSYGGAFGQAQFIPSSFRSYAVDFDHTGRIDIWTSVPDVLASIANYLKKFDWTMRGTIYWDLGRELKDTALVEAFNKGRNGLIPWQVVKKAQAPNMPAPPADKEVTIVGLELDPADGGGMRYVVGYPNFQAITKWNNSNRYAMAVAELAERLKESPAVP